MVCQRNQVDVLIVGDRQGETVPALGDQRVRQAISYAIDREAYNTAVYSGQGGTEGGYYPRDTVWHVEDHDRAYAHDLDRARALLAEAGYADGFSFPMATIPASRVRVETIAQMLKDIGITVTLRPVDTTQIYSTYAKHEVPVYLASIGVAHPNDVWTVTMADNALTNVWKVATPAAARLNAAAAGAVDEAVQRATYAELEQVVLDTGYVTVLGRSAVCNGVAADVGRDGGRPFIYNGERVVRPHGLSVG
jgi:peptide/nickel transport system substrate-binding protein